MFRILSITKTASDGKVTKEVVNEPKPIDPHARRTSGTRSAKHIGSKRADPRFAGFGPPGDGGFTD
jgi:hypothetical protein